MSRHPFKKRWIKTKLKHRAKLNDRYNPKRFMRVTVTETVPRSTYDFLKEWAESLVSHAIS